MHIAALSGRTSEQKHVVAASFLTNIDKQCMRTST
jgi:hypothetical protein